MPNYEYKCPHCNEESEHFFPIIDGPAPNVMCTCGKASVRKYSSFAIQLKGGGWGGQ